MFYIEVISFQCRQILGRTNYRQKPTKADKNRQKPTKTDKKADKYRQKSKQIPTKFLSVFVCLFVGFCCLPF
jgi:Na+(H+)/acetate symporter ActP